MADLHHPDFPTNSAPKSLKISPFGQLEAVAKERQCCGECGRKRMFYCYDCKVYVGGVGSVAPRVELPVDVDIVKHRHELDSKSTAIHALLLAPQRTRLFASFADVPDYNDPNVAVLFPSRHSVSIDQFVLAHGPLRRLVVLDSTWNSVGRLRSLPQLSRLPWVHLRNYRTDYWRPQNGLSSDHLATIEAIYYACRECREAEMRWRRKRNNGTEQEEAEGEEQELDNLLFWFYFFRKMVPERKLTMPCNQNGTPEVNSQL